MLNIFKTLPTIKREKERQNKGNATIEQLTLVSFLIDHHQVS